MRSADTCPELADAIREALAELPEAERPAVLEHLHALAAMPPERRAAVLTLTRPAGS